MKHLLSSAWLALLAACAPALTQAQAVKPSANSQAAGPYGQRADALAWSAGVAQRQGLDAGWIRAQLAKAKFLPQVPRLMTPSGKATAKDWGAYRGRFIDPIRIRAGLRFWEANAEALERAEQMFGVPAEIIVGIIGVETIYGQNMGNLRVLDTLSTLAFDFPQAHPRAAERQKYFQGELEQFLVMMRNTGAETTGPRGSYAGAMGLGQFMPTSWSNWALDFDHDGRIDLFNSPADAIGSVANYFRAHGWVKDLPVWYPAAFNADRLQLPTLMGPDILPSFSPQQMVELGVLPQGGLQHPGLLALIELRNGESPATYIVGTQNFYAITRYNWSSYYAASVFDLGQEIAAARQAKTPAVVQPVPAPSLKTGANPQAEPIALAAPGQPGDPEGSALN